MRKILLFTLLLVGISSFSQDILASAELGAENIHELNLEASFVNVFIENGEKTYFKGVIYGNGEEGDYDFKTDIVGSTLVIKVVSANSGRFKWDWNNVKESRIDLTIPYGVNIKVDNSSGDIKARGLRSSEATFKSSSGDIKLANVVGNLTIETSSGDIQIDGLIGDSRLASTSGEHELTNLKGNIKTKASSGDITISGFDGEIVARATSGDIKIRGGKGTLEVETTSGNIDGNEITLTGHASFDATSGNIAIDFTNHLDEMSFDLRATSGDLNVGQRSADKKLIVEGGGYRVTGVSSSGDQDYN